MVCEARCAPQRALVAVLVVHLIIGTARGRDNDIEGRGGVTLAGRAAAPRFAACRSWNWEPRRGFVTRYRLAAQLTIVHHLFLLIFIAREVSLLRWTAGVARVALGCALLTE